MKHIIAILFIHTSLLSFSQNTFPSSGNAGIGTTSPRSPLEVRSVGNNTTVQTGLIVQQYNPGVPNNTAGISLDFGIGNNGTNNNIEGRVTLKETWFGQNPKMFLSLWDVNNVMQDRMVIDTYGNVGIGTTNPISEFQTNDGYQKIALGKLTPQVGQTLGWASQYIGLNLARNSTGWIANYDGGHNGGSMILGDTFGQFRIVNIPSSGTTDQSLTDSQINQNTRFLISSSGKVGIGLGVVPRSPLEVQVSGDNNSVQTGLIVQQTNPGNPNNKAGVSLDFGIGNNYNNNNIEGRITIKETWFAQNPKMFFSLWDVNNTMQDRVVIDYTGNVGIGTTSPDAKLTVTGQVHAQEVKVTISAPGPDYVFEKDYHLTSLEDIKAYIDQNKHLPEVPSATAMEKNGVQLGEMNMLLLKKIEELTLYSIDMNRKMEEMKRELDAVKSNQQSKH